MLYKKVCIGLLMLLAVVALMSGCASKTAVGTWQGTFMNAIIQEDGTVSGTLFGGYYNYHVCKSEFNDHSITVCYAHDTDATNQVIRKDIYEYRLEGNGNTLTILSQTTIDYHNGVETWRDVQTSGFDWIMTRRN